LPILCPFSFLGLLVVRVVGVFFLSVYVGCWLGNCCCMQFVGWFRFAASQETPRILWNPKVHYCIHTYLPTVPILCQLDPVHWSLRFPQQNPVYASPLPHMCYIPCPSHSSRL